MFNVDSARLDPRWLLLNVGREQFWKSLGSAGLGQRRKRVQPESLLASEVPLPPIEVQRRVVVQAKAIRLIREACEAQHAELNHLRRTIIAHHTGNDVPRVKLKDLIAQVRREVVVSPDETYREIGIRSHGHGIFHKEPVQGIQLENKSIYLIEPGDFVLNIVFAWEGAVALAGEGERGMVGSHRFPTFRAVDDRLDLAFLVLILQTTDGMDLLKRVSPGSAGRNRTLSKTAFLDGTIPLPPIETQRKCVRLVSLIQLHKSQRDAQESELDILSRVLVTKHH